jgi:hypothetical protein
MQLLVSQDPRPVVVDASAAVDFVLRQGSALAIAAQLTSAFLEQHAPDTIDREVINVLRKRWPAFLRFPSSGIPPVLMHATSGRYERWCMSLTPTISGWRGSSGLL